MTVCGGVFEPMLKSGVAGATPVPVSVVVCVVVAELSVTVMVAV